MVYSLDVELELARAKCELYRAEAERRQLWLAAESRLSLRNRLASRLHALANWLEPATSSMYLQPKLKGGL